MGIRLTTGIFWPVGVRYGRLQLARSWAVCDWYGTKKRSRRPDVPQYAAGHSIHHDPTDALKQDDEQTVDIAAQS